MIPFLMYFLCFFWPEVTFPLVALDKNGTLVKIKDDTPSYFRFHVSNEKAVVGRGPVVDISLK